MVVVVVVVGVDGVVVAVVAVMVIVLILCQWERVQINYMGIRAPCALTDDVAR